MGKITKKKMIEDYIDLHPNATETQIYDELKKGKLTFTLPYIRKTASIYRNHKDDKKDDEQKAPDTGEFLSVEDVDKYIKKCMVTGKDPNTSLLNTGIKLLELKNKIEPEAMKKMKEKERIEFDDCIEDALNYVNTLRPDYQVGVPSKPGSDDKTSESEG